MIASVRTLLAAIVVTSLSGPLSAASFAVSSGDASVLYKIELETTTVTTVGPTGVDHLTGLAYHPGMGALFAHQAYDSFNPLTRPGGLYRLDASTGQSQLIDQNGLSVADLAINSTGQLYGWMEKHNPTASGLPAAALDQLTLFDLPDGTPSVFATLGRPNFSSRSGLAFRSDDSLLLKSASNPAQSGGVFFEVNTIDGTVPTGSPFGTYTGITHNSLAFDEHDVAYTIARRSGSSFLQTINIATAQTTDVLDIGVAGISAITFADSNVIPEPSSWTLFAGATVTMMGHRRYRVR